MKRGQVTIFIIIAVLIIALVSLFFVLKKPFDESNIPPDLEPPYTAFLGCFQEAGEQGIYTIATQGGYYNIPSEFSVIYLNEEVPYYYLNSTGSVPPLNLIEEELGKSVSKDLEECFDLESFKEVGFEFNVDYSILANIESNNVQLEMENPLTIKKGETSAQVKEKLNLEYPLKNLYSVSSLVVDSYADNPGLICVTCLEEITKGRSVEINLIPSDISFYNKDIIWFFITDKTDLSEEKLTWRFVVEK